MRNYRKHVSRTTFAACCLLVSLSGKASGLPVPEKPDGIAVEESQSVLQTPAFSVKGVVIDSNTGEPLIGCTVKIKAATRVQSPMSTENSTSVLKKAICWKSAISATQRKKSK